MKKWRYVEITPPNDEFGKELVRPNGMVLEHRYVASKKIGRVLTPKETVHHKDNDPTNNDPDNLMVFPGRGHHTSFHHKLEAEERADGVHVVEKETRSCAYCGKKTENKKYCSKKCFQLDSRVVERPSKEKLADEIEKMSWCAIGRKYGVSDNAIRKWARAYDII